MGAASVFGLGEGRGWGVAGRVISIKINVLT